jgi:asparagine synthase (glutamine-hydrolysing)
MQRFLAITWNSENREAFDLVERLSRAVTARSSDMYRIFSSPGFVLYSTRDDSGQTQVYPLSNGAGVVIGKLFDHTQDETTNPRSIVLGAEATKRVTDSHGRSLLGDYWGRYVAFIRGGGERILVIRDPSGAMNCYSAGCLGIRVLCSEIDDFTSLGLQPLSINWRYLAARLIYPTLQSHETALNEVTRIRAGECLEVQAGLERHRTFYWNIAQLAGANPIEDADVAARLARNTIQTCTNAWASCYPRIVHLLSGGLDSSGILAALLRAPSAPKLVCLNYFDRSAAGDERAFARMALQTASEGAREVPRLEVPRLIECERNAKGVQINQVFEARFSPSPECYIGLVSSRENDLRVAQEHGNVLFTGIGGDPIFYRFHDASPAIDYVHRHGLGAQLPRIALAAAKSGDTFWSVLARATQEGLFGRKRSFPQPTLTAESITTLSAFEHAVRAENGHSLAPMWWTEELLRACRTLSLSKLKHLEALCIPWHMTDRFHRNGTLDWQSPLASQPILELFARLPLYVLAAEGEDRVVARKAFATYLSPELLARRTKGLMDQFYSDLVGHNLRFFRELMLDGMLVKQGLLDRDKLERLLRRAADGRNPEMTPIPSSYFDMEIWLQLFRANTSLSCKVAA